MQHGKNVVKRHVWILECFTPRLWCGAGSEVHVKMEKVNDFFQSAIVERNRS